MLRVNNKWKEFGEYFCAYSSEAYNDTMRAVDQLASMSLVLLDGKPEGERKEILARAQNLTEKLSDVVCAEVPLVAVVAVLTELRVLERIIQQQADERRRARGEP
jgi:hypothetical protein